MSKLQSGKRGSARSKLIPPDQIQDERFGTFMAWLMFILFLCVYQLVSYIVNYGPMMRMLELFESIGIALGIKGLPHPWELPVSMMLALLRFSCGMLLLYRQKWGLYGLLAVHVLSFIIELLLGYFSISSITRLVIVPGVTYWLARPIWKYLE